MTAQEYAQLQAGGHRKAEAEIGRLGPRAQADARGTVRPAGGPAPPADEDEGSWVLAEMVEGHKVDEVVTVGPSHLQDGNHALVNVSDKDGKDQVVPGLTILRSFAEGLFSELASWKHVMVK